MCSISNTTGDVSLVEKVSRMDIEKRTIRNDETLIVKEEELDKLSRFDDLLCEKFGVSKSKIEEHRKDIIEAVATYLKLAPCRIADTINITTLDGAGTVSIGNVINITEQIVLNADNNELEVENLKDYKDYFPMVDRMHWLAQPSVSEITYLDKPAHYVIICHTATQEAFTQAENVLMLRLLQTFHIESQGWADVAYNFCIGSDGNAYEGRGWFVQGSHTMHYNKYSVGIAFIGCFLNNLPPKTSLKKCKDLIAHGVQIGAISKDYELIAHCQCRPFVSPGDRLFKELQTWDHFNPAINNTMPCKFEMQQQE